MKNYYEILEVAKNASPEVIEKAYKALIKKYHPDLQPAEKKHEAENKVKLINEAYDVLSNSEKKSEYDKELNQIEFEKIVAEQKKVKKQQENNTYSNKNYQSQEQNNVSSQIYHQVNKAYNDAYNDAYNEALRNMGYEVRYQKTFKEHLKSIFAVICAIFFVIILCIILWHIPFIKNYLLNLYNNNEFIKLPVDIVHNIFTNFVSLFKK